uniref:Zona pellucida sperm-binding protein 2 n=1 Tax=Salvator merianae TaxID=96440 RepID=A0A8D0E4E9_SALMN
DEIDIWLPKEFGNSSSWTVDILDVSGESIESCHYDVDYEKQMLTAPLANCTKVEVILLLRCLLDLYNVTFAPEDEVFEIGCDTIQADEPLLPSSFISATNCTKDFMSVSYYGVKHLWSCYASCHALLQNDKSLMEWTLSIDEGRKTHKLSLKEAMEQGYTFQMDGNQIVFQASFHATGVETYEQDGRVLYTVAFKLTYGLPDHLLTAESRMICAPGAAACNGTHMIVAVPPFPGTLAAVTLDNRQVLLNQQQTAGISVDTKRGVKLYISKRLLKSRLSQHGCSGFQSYISALKLDFDYQGELASMATHLECPCEQNAPIVALCTQDGHMSFEVDSSNTKPALNLDTLTLLDPACKPVFRSPSNDVVRFYINLGFSLLSALLINLPPRSISRDSEFRMTVICSYGNDDASLNVKINSLPSPGAVINQGPLSLILLLYPDESYSVPYNDDQYPIVKYLQQPIFLEVQVLKRNDPNIYLMLDDCWATLSLEPSSLPRWNIVTDGCSYALDNYRTLFHPAGPSVSFPNFRQRFEVKAFAFVSGGKALPSLVYFHCSVIICNRFQLDSPLCSLLQKAFGRMPETVQSPSFPEKLTKLAAALCTSANLPSEAIWITTTLTVGVTLGLAAIMLGLLALFKFQKRTVLIN